MKIKRIILLFLGGLLMLGLFGCEKKYRVTYDDIKLYNGARESYKAGERVVFYYDVIATDTSYSFYLDGEKISYSYNEQRGIEISFVMPDHDVVFYCSSRNDMANVIQKRQLVVFSTGVSGTDGGDHSVRYALYEMMDEYYIEKVESDVDGEKTEEYKVDESVWLDCVAEIKKHNFESWASLKDYECLDGGYTSLWYNFGKVVSVSTGKMPSDGVQMMKSVGSILEECYKVAKENANQ